MADDVLAGLLNGVILILVCIGLHQRIHALLSDLAHLQRFFVIVVTFSQLFDEVARDVLNPV
jgi:hypothetical protein